MECKEGDVMKIGEELDMLMEQLKELQNIFNKERIKSGKYSETIKVLQKYLKLKNQRKQQQKIKLAYTQIVLK